MSNLDNTHFLGKDCIPIAQKEVEVNNFVLVNLSKFNIMLAMVLYLFAAISHYSI